jgi:hypothetical protein
MRSVYRRFRFTDVLKACGTTPRDYAIFGTSQQVKLATVNITKTSIPSQAKVRNSYSSDWKTIKEIQRNKTKRATRFRKLIPGDR